MDKFEMLEKLQDAGIDVAGELVCAMTSDQADELLGYIANTWDVEIDKEEEEEEDPRYTDPDVQRAYEFACKWLYDDDTAAAICDMIGVYGSPYTMISAQEWNEREHDDLEDYECVIGEDIALDYYVITLV